MDTKLEEPSITSFTVGQPFPGPVPHREGVIMAMKMIGLNPDAVKLFHDTIRKQLGMDYNKTDYLGCLGGFFTRTTKELFDMGRKFQHR